MADIALQHLSLGQLLAFVLLRVVVVVVMNDRATAVMAQLRGCHRWSFQVTAEVFQAAPGTSGLFGEVHFTGAAVLCMQVAMPPGLMNA